ncbi:MAG: hypothetical protein J6C46_01145 [Clostridia bacterium]|nr:hypothetical protein [Clostridia bacterium]
MDNYYYNLYEEQVKTNDYLETIDSNIETIMQNDIIYQTTIMNSCGLLACGLYILIFLILLLFVVSR